MDIIKYLKRISISGISLPDYENLRILHRNHLLNIPFENLDIHLNIKIRLELQYLKEKIINGNRGGYCYELNGLFYNLLRNLGFNVKMISARVSDNSGGFGEEFDHLAIIAETDRLWLADVGFGDSFIEPLEIKLNEVQKDPTGFYRISEFAGTDYLSLQKSSDGLIFKDEYIFTFKERKWNEFEEMNNYHQTSPDSPFTKKLLCSIAKENGRITLTDRNLTVTEGNVKKIADVKDKDDFNNKLFEYFGMKM
ncbi:MAG: arylamine N-acetyltransferase [Bacteroidetes bacterium]|nr:arylamine N-acetyltransferase [Bacteroidota bacterium]